MHVLIEYISFPYMLYNVASSTSICQEFIIKAMLFRMLLCKSIDVQSDGIIFPDAI